MSSVFPLPGLIVPPTKGQIRLARKEIMGYAGGVSRCMAFVNDVIVFPIFIAVSSRPQQSFFSLNGLCRTGTCRSDIRSGGCMVSGIAIHPCPKRSCFFNPGTANYNYNTTFNQRVSNIFNWRALLDVRVPEMALVV